MGVGKDIYDSTASFGRIWALMGAIFATIIGLGMIALGIYLVVRKPDRDMVHGRITKINGLDTGRCQTVQNTQNSSTFSCTITVQYVYDGQTYVADVNYNGSTFYAVNQVIPVYVLKVNPTSITISEPIPKWFGGVFIGVGAFLALLSWFWYWAAKKWKVVAAAEGAGGLLGIVSKGRW